MLTEQQTRLIAECIELGYGTAQFAMSVKRQGSCTEKQFTTMQRLLSAAAEYRRGNPQRRTSRQTQLDAAFADYSEGGYF